MPKIRVMVVDDTITQLSVAREILKQTYEVLPVTSGVKALQALERMEETPNLLLLDISMPDISGFEVMSRMRQNEKLRDIPIVLLSGHDEADKRAEGFALGAVAFLQKPYAPSELLAIVESHCKISGNS